ncbi:hypothetical protein SMACR_04205 [Sordaria macrospora]|uniref:Uncharacterized protein n=1 Tax=Sordaria macrospora TaxID=5147 RepID=A0A8S8Z9D8_SORMA|nr:hypothetical protein SMACR_04205 [Sordaria macrospora]WPJ65189.1 hypothetical protein SMAC4_04205 [Sordaria macrospora]
MGQHRPGSNQRDQTRRRQPDRRLRVQSRQPRFWRHQQGPQCDSTILSTGRAGPKEVDMDKSIKLKSRKEEVRLKIGYASSAGPDRPKAALDTASQDASAMTG